MADLDTKRLYFMESDEESLRLDLKTDPAEVAEQAGWAGIRPGMRVVDLGCGAGRTTQVLHQLVQPGGEVIGVDCCQPRIAYAREHHSQQGVTYAVGDARESLAHLGHFDLVWIRFLLEYYEQSSPEIVRNACRLVRPGGTICLIDLDQNCLGHFGASPRLDQTMRNLVFAMQKQYGFDPYVGRKLYACLYDLGCADIEVRVSAHHLIYGQLSDNDRFNWLAKAEAARNAPGLFADTYPGGFEEFRRELVAYLEHPRRFIYTPIVMCKGKPPSALTWSTG
jgi:ubiquinone/menaquinone biosynthesis C-methylase UbiE